MVFLNACEFCNSEIPMSRRERQPRRWVVVLIHCACSVSEENPKTNVPFMPPTVNWPFWSFLKRFNKQDKKVICLQLTRASRHFFSEFIKPENGDCNVNFNFRVAVSFVNIIYNYMIMFFSSILQIFSKSI